MAALHEPVAVMPDVTVEGRDGCLVQTIAPLARQGARRPGPDGLLGLEEQP